MPGTVNGIGTMYYGKRHISSRPGVCEKCGREIMLESYETGEYFTLLFIPVLPLGRKQILDYCPHCTRHRAMSLQQWQTMQQEATQEAAQLAETDPDDPEANLERLRMLVAFRQEDEALELAETMATKFADNFDIQLALAVWHEEDGRDEPSNTCLHRAFEIQPDHPGVRRAVAIGCIQQGELDRAKALLDFMLEPDAEREPVVPVMLADAYQAEGMHREALEFYELALGTSPELGHDKLLRQRIAISEEAAGSETTMLPALPWRPSRLGVVWAAATVILIAALGTNYYVKTHQTVHLVNRLDHAVTVTIDEQPARTVRNKGFDTITLAEGTHRAVFTGGEGGQETIEFQVHNGLFQRYFGDSVFVVNFGAAANLLWEETVYSARPDPTAVNPYRIHFGETSFVFRDIDYVFCEFPPNLRTESRRLKKTRVSVIDFEPMAVITGFPDDTPIEERMRFAETHLPRHANDEQFLRFYRAYAALAGKLAECRSFLEAGLQRRPVAIEWHRVYQDVCKETGDREQLQDRYDRLLEQDPKDSALLYLRGRIEPESRLAEPFYERAIAADPENAYPLFAKAYRRVAQADFAAAEPLLAEATRLNPDSLSIRELFFEVRLGLAKYDELRTELLAAREQFPLDIDIQEKLLRLSISEGNPDGARQTHEAYAVQGEVIRQPLLVLRSRMALNYYLGRLDAYRDDVADWRREQGAEADDLGDFSVYLELGELERAEELIESEQATVTGIYALLLSFAWNEEGDPTKAASWRDRAVAAFQAATGEEPRIASLLEQADQVGMEDIDNISPTRVTMLVALVALAEQSPQLRQELLQRAERLNLVGGFPYQFLKRTIDSRKKTGG